MKNKNQSLTLIIISLLLVASTSKKIIEKDSLQQQKFFPFPPQTGYIPIYNDPKNSMFYWYFEAENSPETAPVIIWLDGGPGCASTWGLFGQVGPYEVDQYDETHKMAKLRTINWSQNAHLIFPDQPLGIGFSTVTEDKIARNYKQLQEQFIQFYEGFLEKHPNMKKRDIYIIGESYGGHYAPYIGDILLRSENPNIKVKGIGIINGYMDGKILYKTYPDFSLKVPQYTGFQQSDYDKIQPIVNLCENMINYRGNPMLAYQEVCDKISENIQSIAKKFKPDFDPYYMPGNDTTNYSFVGFLNDKEIQNVLGVSKEFTPCNSYVGNLFGASDYFVDSRKFIAELLSNDVKVLVFDGDLDWICNYLQEEINLDEMNWYGKIGWRNQELKECEFGMCKEYLNLRYVRFKGAGHAAPKFQPGNALKLVNEFIGVSNGK